MMTVPQALKMAIKYHQAGNLPQAEQLCRQILQLDPHQVDHVLPLKHGGSDELGNLAYSCLACNLHKGPNLTGIDLLRGKLTRLFHPRRHKWSWHFRWDGPRLVGRTAIGRTTVVVLGRPSIDTSLVADPSAPAAVLTSEVAPLAANPPSGLKVEVVRPVRPGMVGGQPSATVVLSIFRPR